MKIFVSYPRDESEPLAARVFERLAQAFGRYDVIRDVDAFASGAQEIVWLNFMSLATTTNNAVAFADQPVIRAVSDSAANELSASYANSAVTVNPPPTLSISFTNGSATLSWPAWAAGFNLQGSLDNLLVPGCTNVSSTTQTNGSNVSVTVPTQSQGGLFRLQHP